MQGSIPLDLLSEIRHLADDVAPHDPDSAMRRFDELIAIYGRSTCAEVLNYVAPEVNGPSPSSRH